MAAQCKYFIDGNTKKGARAERSSASWRRARFAFFKIKERERESRASPPPVYLIELSRSELKVPVVLLAEYVCDIALEGKAHGIAHRVVLLFRSLHHIFDANGFPVCEVVSGTTNNAHRHAQYHQRVRGVHGAVAVHVAVQ